MFRTAEVGKTISQQDYQSVEPLLRQTLITLQQQLRCDKPFSVVVVFAGVDGAGKADMVKKLNEWMDPRWLHHWAYRQPNDEECQRPPYWRYWRDLPPRGELATFLSCWYSAPLVNRVYQRINQGEFERQLAKIRTFEKMLQDDGTLIIKFWMHLSKSAQHERLRRLHQNNLKQWQIKPEDWRNWQRYERFISVAEQIITQTGQIPFKIVEGSDESYRRLAVSEHIIKTLTEHLAQTQSVPTEPQAKTLEQITPLLQQTPTILSTIDLSKRLSKSAYQKQLATQQSCLHRRHSRLHQRQISTLLLFEGWDAAGKGGCIRRVTEALPASGYRIIPFAAPTDEEQGHHYLWRFWRHLQSAGDMTIYDRSWYGRVLVERVEQLIDTPTWQRAYAEINAFEEQLIRHGILLIKFWLHIDADEQLKRFENRQNVGYKRWKLTEEDWRNRERRTDYEHAVDDMVQQTSTRLSPWHLIGGNDKRTARIEVLKTINRAMKARLKAD